MKSSHSCCRKVHKALLNSRRCYCTVELYYVAENFTAQQKALLHSRKVSPMAEIGENFPLWQKQRISPLYCVFSWNLDSTLAYKLAVVEWYFGAHSAEC